MLTIYCVNCNSVKTGTNEQFFDKQCVRAPSASNHSLYSRILFLSVSVELDKFPLRLSSEFDWDDVVSIKKLRFGDLMILRTQSLLSDVFALTKEGDRTRGTLG